MPLSKTTNVMALVNFKNMCILKDLSIGEIRAEHWDNYLCIQIPATMTYWFVEINYISKLIHRYITQIFWM